MNLYLMRHGETLLNHFNKIQGWSDAPLTLDGVDQVVTSAQRLWDVPFDAVYASDLGRTMSTAEIVLEMNARTPHMKIQPKAAFREVFFGSLEGLSSEVVWGDMAQYLGCRTIEEVERRFSLEKELDVFHLLDPTHEAETAKRFHARLQPGITELLEKHSPCDEHVLLVGHGLTIRFIIQALVPNAPVQGRFLGNASLSCIECNNQTYSMKYLNILP